MKFLVIILLGIALYGNTSDTYAWDSTAAKYMPLQVGNVRVYRGVSSGYIYYGNFYLTIKITGIVDTIGRRYYKTQQRITQITGNSSCGIWHYGEYIRIDSVTMNFYKLYDYCNSNETILDSLRARLNDTTVICPDFSHTRGICIDTSIQNIFGVNRSTKRYSSLLGPSIGATYAKGIGIIGYGYGYQMNQCYDSLKGCIINGILYGDTSTIVGINQISSEIPERFELSQNYPNPFNPSTHFGFRIAESGLVRLSVYDVLGKEVQILVNEELQPGSYEADWDATDYPSGVYYYKLETGKFTETKKMVLIK